MDCGDRENISVDDMLEVIKRFSSARKIFKDPLVNPGDDDFMEVRMTIISNKKQVCRSFKLTNNLWLAFRVSDVEDNEIFIVKHVPEKSTIVYYDDEIQILSEKSEFTNVKVEKDNISFDLYERTRDPFLETRMDKKMRRYFQTPIKETVEYDTSVFPIKLSDYLYYDECLFNYFKKNKLVNVKEEREYLSSSSS